MSPRPRCGCQVTERWGCVMWFLFHLCQRFICFLLLFIKLSGQLLLCPSVPGAAPAPIVGLHEGRGRSPAVSRNAHRMWGRWPRCWSHQDSRRSAVPLGKHHSGDSHKSPGPVDGAFYCCRHFFKYVHTYIRIYISMKFPIQSISIMWPKYPHWQKWREWIKWTLLVTFSSKIPVDCMNLSLRWISFLQLQT